MRKTINEIIIAKDGCRTIIGEIAHKLAANMPLIFRLSPTEKFHVFECAKDGVWLHRAACSNRSSAKKYWTDGRVLVSDLRPFPRYYVSSLNEHDWVDSSMHPKGGYKSFDKAKDEARYWHSQGYNTRVTDDLGVVRAEFNKVTPQHA